MVDQKPGLTADFGGKGPEGQVGNPVFQQILDRSIEQIFPALGFASVSCNTRYM